MCPQPVPKIVFSSQVMKDNIDIFSLKLSNDFNHSIEEGAFPSNLKNADVTPIHKKGDRTDKSTYRPVSILPAMSKIMERLILQQLHTFCDKILSKYQCGFRKHFSSQQCLILMLEKWKQTLDSKGVSGALLTDLSKAFDCLEHDLMIAKLNAYGFGYKALKIIRSYLVNRQQRVKVNSSYSSWTEIISGVPQGSILGPLLFNVYLSDLFLFFKDSNIANYADDNTPFAYSQNTNSVLLKLEDDSKKLIQWVSENFLTANADKFHLITSDPNLSLSVKVDKYTIANTTSQKLLGITIDNKLTFDEHISRLCNKASQKLHALARIATYMNLSKRRIIMKAFISSQFGYCPLVWMLCSRRLNHRINKIQERALRIVYRDQSSTFEDLLTRDGSVSNHVRNLQFLATEVYKVVNGTSLDIMNEVFQLKETTLYNSKFPFKTRNIKTERYGRETLSFLGPKIWALVPDDIKTSKSLVEFKQLIKTWIPINCPCRLCKTFVAGVGFVDSHHYHINIMRSLSIIT